MTSIDVMAMMDYGEDANYTSSEENVTFSLEAVFCPHIIDKKGILYTVAVVFIFIFVIGLVANSVVIWVNLWTKRVRYETHTYILNLAVADLFVVITLPVWVASLVQNEQWPMGEAMCKVTHLIFSVNLFGSIFFLTCMSVDRYISVAFLKSSNTYKKKAIRWIICIFLWLFAFGVSFPDTYYLQVFTSPHNGDTYCRPAYPKERFQAWLVGMELVSIILGFAFPFPILAIFCLLLARVVSSSSDQDKKASRKIIFSYVIVFLICWLPYHSILIVDTMYLLKFIPINCTMEDFLYVSLHVTQCLSLIHCCVNPILYSFINKNYRYDLMKAFISKYSAKTGLTKIVDASKLSETDYTALTQTVV
ncbi:atypical chemokine receptor 3 [Protopterus annectens]|uniref:atypical chemokine receptor 3 n=1 Tax=Protopterus annectens TaxID=7888 RepID=UPI001CFA1CBB|nr:atypical chemokine receptor 3 [Protopterus annectens]XP_043916532.1 atypical chemokine receptor 3 [Protopterus annectens]XP_043916533.1 atypical chemokine receptor 3 [Protopterus annectens]